MTRRVSAIAAVMAATLYSSFLLSYLVGGPRQVNFVSELERPGAPYAGWYRASDLIAGVLMLLIARACWPGRTGRTSTRWAALSLVVVGACSMLDGLSSMDCATSVQGACALDDHSASGLLRQLVVGHTLSGLAGFMAAGIGAACCARAAWARQAAQPLPRPGAPSTSDAWQYASGSSAAWWMRVHIVLAAGIGICGLGDLMLLLGQVDVGLVERVRVVLVSLWIAAVPWTVHAVQDARCARRAHINDHQEARS